MKATFYNNPYDLLAAVNRKLALTTRMLQGETIIACDDPMGQPFPVHLKNHPTIKKVVAMLEKAEKALDDLKSDLPENISTNYIQF